MKLLTERFASRYIPEPNSGCWLWMGHATTLGYGMLKNDNGKRQYAHRISYFLHYGKSPGMAHVLHKCDNPPCVNPEHLFLGTQSDNMRDMAAKGRHWDCSGERSPFAKLSAADVYQIRAAKGGTSAIALGQRYGVGRCQIYAIWNRRSWINLPETG